MSWLYVVAAAAGLAIAALVFLARPGRLQNRLLALALLFEVVATVRMAAYHGLPGQLDVGLAHALNTLLWFAVWGHSAAYLGFLGTVDTRWSDLLGSHGIRLGLAVVVAAAWTLRLAAPQVSEVVSLNILAGAVGLYGLLIAGTYWRSTEPGTLRRRQAKAYAAAFGARDLMFVLLGLLTVRTVLGAEPLMFFGDWLALWFPGIGVILFAPLAAYGILTTQLFDVDLKIKWGISRSTVAAVFVAVFFVVSESAQVLFADFAGSEVVGVLAAGALVFFLAPLQRLGERVSDAAMPGVEDTPEYRERRKEEIYRAQLEELMADDQISSKERRALLRLQEDLGLDGETANQLERDVLGAVGGEA